MRRQNFARSAVVGLLYCGLVIGPFWFAPWPAQAQSGGGPAIAAASDLQFALTEVAAAFEAGSKKPVRLSFGSSGNLARQIRQGAPFEIFFSADESFVADLERESLTIGGGDLYAIGRIGLMVPKGSSIPIEGGLDALRAALADGRVKKLAIANPEHAPYGKRAEEALRHAGMWTLVQGKLVLGENVTQAAQFVSTGNAEVGIVAYSLALAPSIAAVTSFTLIPEAWHQPLLQRMVLLRTAGPTAKEFYAYAVSPEARTILRRHGFSLPGEVN